MRIEIGPYCIGIYGEGLEIYLNKVEDAVKVRDWLKEEKIINILYLLNYAIERVEMSDEVDENYLNIELGGYIWYGADWISPFGKNSKLKVHKNIYEKLKKIYEALKAQQ